MAKEFARKFYNSTRWRKCAKAFAQSKLFVCEMCHNQTSEKIDGDQRYIVHHKIPLTPKNINDPYITCGWNNLMFLCLECHNKIHIDILPMPKGRGFLDTNDTCLLK